MKYKHSLIIEKFWPESIIFTQNALRRNDDVIWDFRFRAFDIAIVDLFFFSTNEEFHFNSGLQTEVTIVW